MKDVFVSLVNAFADPERNGRQTVYVYRIAPSGRVVKPYLFKTTGWFDNDGELLSFLRDEHRGGAFRVLIRDGSQMVFAGEVSVWEPRQQRRQFT